MVRVLFARTDDLPDPLSFPSLLKEIVPSRRERLLRLPSARERRLRLGAELLLERELRARGRSAEEISADPNGKPRMEGLCFSCSHSRDAAALAFAEGEVGCDVEQLRPRPVHAERVFSAAERDGIARAEDADGMFFRLWTAKESYLKMTGEGLSALAMVEIAPEGVLRGGILQNCRLRTSREGEYMLSVCAVEEIGGVEHVTLG